MKSNISSAPNVGIRSPSNYKSHLDRMWGLHLADRAKGAPTVISTFAGGGGSSLGYSMAGYDERLAVEWDDHAVETFRDNFPAVPVYHGDIGRLGLPQCLDMARVEVGGLDILDGSPPCQGFSTAGRRDINDDRNQLFREFCRLLEGLQPKVFVMENVSGMVKGKMKLIFAEVLRTLKGCGYQVSARLLNAMYFNVPQSRQRMIFVGVRDGLGVVPSHPKPECLPVNFSSAIRDCATAAESRCLIGKAKTYAPFHPGGWSVAMGRYKALNGTSAGGMSLKFAGLHDICGTLVKQEISSSGVVHPNRKRYLSLPEYKRLASFPDGFLLSDRKRGIERIGNSVPPLMMEAIGRHIKGAVLAKVK
jgi:DNA (cytosine-5)-methyltransferase 1